MAILGDVWRSSSLLSCVAEPSPSPQPCTNSSAQASPRLRNPVCTAVIARSSIFACQFQPMELPTRGSGWIGRSAACPPTKQSATIRSEPRLMRKLLNTLHVTTQGAYVHRDGETVSVKIAMRSACACPFTRLRASSATGRSPVALSSSDSAANAGSASRC
jgi:hypothetical protein